MFLTNSLLHVIVWTLEFVLRARFQYRVWVGDRQRRRRGRVKRGIGFEEGMEWSEMSTIVEMAERDWKCYWKLYLRWSKSDQEGNHHQDTLIIVATECYHILSRWMATGGTWYEQIAKTKFAQMLTIPMTFSIACKNCEIHKEVPRTFLFSSLVRNLILAINSDFNWNREEWHGPTITECGATKNIYFFLLRTCGIH